MPAFTLPTNLASVENFVGAMYGYSIGTATVSQVNADIVSYGSLNAALNTYYTSGFGTLPTATVAATVVANLGIVAGTNGLVAADVTQAVTYVTGVLNAAPANARGAAILNVVNLFNGLSGTTGSLANFSAAATVWSNNESASVIYAGTNVLDSTLAAAVTTVATTTAANALAAATLAAAPKLLNLTTGPDTVGSATATSVQNFVGTTADSLSAFDNLTGGTSGADSLSANITATTIPAAITITNIPTVNLTTSGAGFTGDTTKFTGLTNFTVGTNNAAADPVSITSAVTTNVIASASGTLGGSMTVSGGNNVSTTQSGTAGGNLSITGEAGAVTVNDAQAGNTIIVTGGTGNSITATNQTASTATIALGTTAKPATGAISVNATSAFADASTTQGTITTIGGTSVSITENTALVSTVSQAAGAATLTAGAVSVTGTAVTTAVTVNQTTAVVAAALTTVANSGATAVTGVAAATGVQAITAITAATGYAALLPNDGIVDGAVTISDAGIAQTAAGTITSVTLNNYANSTIADNALTTLNLGGTAGTLSITNNNTTQIAARANTLTLNLSGTTGLSITPTGAATSNSITDTNNEISTLNVNTANVASRLTGFVDSNLTTINVVGTGATANGLTLNSVPGSLTALNVSGTANFSDGATSATSSGSGLSSLGAALKITDSSSGTFAAAINDKTQTFTSTGSGADTIIISDLADATQTITAGTSTANEIRLEGGAYALTSSSAGKFVNFQTVGVAANVTGTVDMSVVDPTANKLNIPSASTNVTFTKTPTNAAVSIAGSSDTLVVGYLDSTGPTDIVTVTLATGATALTSAGITVTSLTLADANSTGVGTVNLVSNAGTKQFSTTATNTITTLVDNGLGTLNVTGTSGLVITTLNQASTAAASFTLGNTNTGATGVTITTLTDASMNTLAFTGSGASTITTLNTSAPTLTITNTGGVLNRVNTINANNLTSLTLANNVGLGMAGSASSAVGLQDTSTAGIVISGGLNNSHVTLNLAGAASTKTDTITLGNGNNYVLDTSSAGTVNVTVGSGANLIQLGSTFSNTTGTYNITLGARSNTLWNQIVVGTGGTTFASAPNYFITNANIGDAIGFGADGNSSSTVTLVSLSTATSVASAIGILEGASGLNSTAGRVAYGVYAGNTYVVETQSGTTSASDTTVIQISGTPTLTGGAGGITIGSTAATPYAAASSSNTFTVSAATTNAVTLVAGANSVIFSNATTFTTGIVTTITSVAATTGMTVNMNAIGSGTTVGETITLAGSGGAALSDATSLIINSTTSAVASSANSLTISAFTDTNLSSLTLNASGGIAASNITATAITAPVSNLTFGGTVAVANVISITTLSDNFAGAVTINDNSISTGTLTIPTITLSATSLTINDTISAGVGALRLVVQQLLQLHWRRW